MEPSFIDLINNLLHVFSSGFKEPGSIHPLVVHFPIVLLLAAPFFILAGLIFKNSNKALFTSGLVMMLAGTLTVFFAAHTGELATEALGPNPEIVSTLEAHEHLGEEARLYFSILSGIFLLYMLLKKKLTQKLTPALHTGIMCAFLIIYSLGLVILFNAAHYGGKLVHDHGIKSNLYK